MSTAHLHQNETLLCDVRRVIGSDDKEFVFQGAQLLPFNQGDAVYIITDVAPKVGIDIRHYITFDHLPDTLHIEITSVNGQPPDFMSSCKYLKRT